MANGVPPEPSAAAVGGREPAPRERIGRGDLDVHRRAARDVPMVGEPMTSDDWKLFAELAADLGDGDVTGAAWR